jgi:hypothetical protein
MAHFQVIYLSYLLVVVVVVVVVVVGVAVFAAAAAVIKLIIIITAPQNIKNQLKSSTKIRRQKNSRAHQCMGTSTGTFSNHH